MLRMNELASNRGTTSKITPRLDAHVNKVTYTLFSEALLSNFESKFNFTYNGAKIIDSGRIKCITIKESQFCQRRDDWILKRWPFIFST